MFELAKNLLQNLHAFHTRDFGLQLYHYDNRARMELQFLLTNLTSTSLLSEFKSVKHRTLKSTMSSKTKQTYSTCL